MDRFFEDFKPFFVIIMVMMPIIVLMMLTRVDLRICGPGPIACDQRENWPAPEKPGLKLSFGTGRTD